LLGGPLPGHPRKRTNNSWSSIVTSVTCAPLNGASPAGYNAAARGGWM
jgi:hypothetical protein